MAWTRARAAAAHSSGEGKGSGGDDGKPPMPRFRPALWTGLLEYFAIGHDDAVSGLAGEIVMSDETRCLERPCSGVDLRALTAEEREEGLAFFFGGVGDARHLFATLRDVYLQCSRLRSAFGASDAAAPTSSSSKGGKKGKRGASSSSSSSSSSSGGGGGTSSTTPPPRVSFVMNDIKPHALAQGFVMFAAVLELAEAMEAKGSPADSAAALGSTQDATLLKLGGRVLSLFAARLLLPEDAAWIKALMERALASQGCPVAKVAHNGRR